jgi:carbon monoxide dehydrogenase subunit G
MDFSGRYRFSASRAAVWAALNDAAVLKAVIPGCETIAWTGPSTLDLRIKVNLGFIHPVFSGELELSNVLPAASYRLAGRGRGVVGLAQGAADISLAGNGEETILSFTAEGSADGRIMQLGRKLIGNSAQKVIDGFFGHIGKEKGDAVTPLPHENV